MDKSPWWAKSPITVVPAGLAALGIIFVPFVIGTTDHAAEFYGAFFAAIVAAMAAISGYFIQSSIDERRTRTAVVEEENRDAMLVYTYVVLLLVQVQQASAKLKLVKFRTQPGNLPSPNDVAEPMAKTLRHVIPKIEAMPFDQIINRSRAFPIPVAFDIAVNSFEISTEATSYRFMLIPDEGFPSRNNIEGAATVLASREIALTRARDGILVTLRAKGLV
jgi:hypothetical protein